VNLLTDLGTLTRCKHYWPRSVVLQCDVWHLINNHETNKIAEENNLLSRGKTFNKTRIRNYVATRWVGGRRHPAELRKQTLAAPASPQLSCR
jgi:hypothetical protein